jgi:hypothetical protein
MLFSTELKREDLQVNCNQLQKVVTFLNNLEKQTGNTDRELHDLKKVVSTQSLMDEVE